MKNTKIIKPRPINLNDQAKHQIECGDIRDFPYVYLKPATGEWLWISKKKAKQLRDWLDRAIIFLEQK